MSDPHTPYLTIRSLGGGGGGQSSRSGPDSAYASASASTSSDFAVPTATHDIGRVSYHVQHLDSFARTLETSACRAFPNRGRSQQRYTKVVALLMHWKSDDLFVLPELQDLEKCMREYYGFETDTFSIPSENAHLELMLRIGALIKDHEATDTLFVVYYGGHARIDESRQSTWCATRNPNSPWLQWSAIQTLLERSVSDTLILLDCCAGAASATFPSGKSITETISASSWDAIAPDPGRYSFTSTLIEVLLEWRLRTFSAAMLHAEVLARLKHPRPITINGKLFEARSTPVHFMMTSNHRAPSIEIGRMHPRNRHLPSPPAEPDNGQSSAGPSGGRGPLGEPVSGPNEDEPHVMISLALEEDQNLDLNAWEQWLASFPALAKYVKVQGVFKSHSTLLLLSVPVMVWDLLPENHACSFVAFIRSNNLIKEKAPGAPSEGLACTQDVPVHGDGAAIPPSRDVGERAAGVHSGAVSIRTVSDSSDRGGDGGSGGDGDDDGDDSDGSDVDDDAVSVISGTTFTPTEGHVPSIRMSIASTAVPSIDESGSQRLPMPPRMPRSMTSAPGQRPQFHSRFADGASPFSAAGSASKPRPSLTAFPRRSMSYGPKSPTGHHGHLAELGPADQRQMMSLLPSKGTLPRSFIMNQQKIARLSSLEDDHTDGPQLAQHIADRLEEYFQKHPNPSVGIAEFFASNLGVEKRDIDLWFHRRRQQEMTTQNLQNLKMVDYPSLEDGDANGAKMILPGQLNKLLDIFPPTTILFVDLRSPTTFEKSHIYGAVNLRIPASFVEDNFDLIEYAFTDDQSRRSFARASASRCVIFYDRVLEFPWECPMADALLEQLREKKGWKGEGYVLKGHYREFSASFDKYITGDRMTQAAKDYMDSLRQRTPPTANEREDIEDRYAEWRALVEQENRKPTSDAKANLGERWQAVEQHQAELEAELESRNPVLYRKTTGLRPTPLQKSYFPGSMYGMQLSKGSMSSGQFSGRFQLECKDPELRTDLVGPLTRGLERMHGGSGGGGGGEGPYQTAPGYDKFTEFGEGSSAASMSDDFDDIDPRDEQLREDPAFLKAGDLGGGGGLSGDARRKSEKPFWKRLRVNK